MQITDTPTGPWQKLAIDFVGELPITNEGNKYIMSVQDNFSKFVIIIPTKSQDAETTAEAFVENIILKFGCPELCLSDRGSNFTSKLFKNCLKLLRVKQLLTTAFRPQTNGSLERFHRPLKDFLKAFVNDSQSNWDKLCPMAQFVHNSTPSETTKFTPHMLMFGRECTMPSSVKSSVQKNVFTTYEDFVMRLANNLRQMHEIAARNLVKGKEKNKTIYDEKLNEVNFSISDEVFLQVESVRQGRSKKLGPQWSGPYKIIEKIGETNYRIKKGRKEKIVHANKLKFAFE